MRAFLTHAVRRDAAFGGAFGETDYCEVEAFYGSHPELAPTPLREMPGLAASIGIGALLVKDETSRFGLNAFKTVGVRFALHRLGAAAVARGVVCATAGNHGRAVARAARDLGVPCTVFVPAASFDMSPAESRTRTARVNAMRDDGAAVVEVTGTYEEAVRRASAHGVDTGATVVSDTAWPGYDEIPRSIMAGYTRIVSEATAQWRRPPDVVLVQGGVGGLVCAVASWFAWHLRGRRPFLIACEPEGAACLLASADAGRIVRLDSTQTMMAGLRCAEPSPAAWPAIRDGIDAFVAIPDSIAAHAMAALASGTHGDPAILSGPSGACGVGALMALANDPALEPVRQACGLNRSTRAMAVVTEGE
jgi:diaminopropionate ammonia-lyase